MSTPTTGDRSRVILMCGPAGAGKSTFAKALEGRGFVRLSIDAELWRRGVRGAVPDDKRAAAQRFLEDRLAELVEAGRDVVVDSSFWRRADRDHYRELVTRYGGTCELVYFQVAREELHRRIARRNTGTGADSVHVDAATLDRYIDGFEVPTPDEAPVDPRDVV
ncbi:AAA family ATPase [Antribacter gilvus]|uniref:AAA family ATPase n=1 Tax=Antribacter gilvus TaxID=2304675 RepID=UPI000F77F879|nr:ATP-binding protein [Antribacter gilvus]